MDQLQKLRLNNRLTYLTTWILIFCFVLALALVVLPRLPSYPSEPGEQRLFVSTWNFACTLMWMMVFRVQIFNGLHDLIERREPKRGVTPWVKFWFAASVMIGSATVIYVFHSFMTKPLGSAVYAEVLASLSVVTWIALVTLATLLFRSKGSYSRNALHEVEKALSMHRWLLAPASLLFFLSTFLFPMFFLL